MDVKFPVPWFLFHVCATIRNSKPRVFLSLPLPAALPCRAGREGRAAHWMPGMPWQHPCRNSYVRCSDELLLHSIAYSCSLSFCSALLCPGKLLSKQLCCPQCLSVACPKKALFHVIHSSPVFSHVTLRAECAQVGWPAKECNKHPVLPCAPCLVLAVPRTPDAALSSHHVHSLKHRVRATKPNNSHPQVHNQRSGLAGRVAAAGAAVRGLLSNTGRRSCALRCYYPSLAGVPSSLGRTAAFKMPTTIASLPDKVLAWIFEHLTFSERHQSVVQVCKRWRLMMNLTPQLLSTIDLAVGGGTRAAARLCSFSRWLLQHGVAHVQKLNIEFSLTEDHPDSEQLAAAVQAALVGCGVAGRLRALRVVGPLGQLGIWACSLRSVRRLVLVGEQSDHDEEEDLPSWGNPALPALEQLQMAGDIQLPPSIRLPPSLTRLHLCYRWIGDTQLPHRLTALTRLHTLSLEQLECPSAGYWALAQLPSLRRLVIRNCTSWPACLSSLTRLEALALDDEEVELLTGADEQGSDIIAAAMPRLRHLTLLALDSVHGEPLVPAALTCLTGLHSFHWLEGGGGALPPGSWLCSVRQLAANAACIADSLPALAAATQLEQLGALFGGDQSEDDRFPDVLCAAAHLPALQRLVLRGSRELFGDNVEALLAAQRARPALQISCRSFERQNFDSAWAEFCSVCGYSCRPDLSRAAFLNTP
ncbi:hypothetical protein ABPG75_009663 [Micractinium tetrahymenae]